MVGFKNLAALASALVPLGAALSVENKYIVTLKSDIPEVNITSHLSWLTGVHKRNAIGRRDLLGIGKRFDIGRFHAYSGSFDSLTIEELRNNPDVLGVEEDKIYTLSDVVTQENSTYGLGIVSSRSSGASSYSYDDSAGEGTYAYVVDSGIRTTHDEFDGRASFGYNAADGDDGDSIGHGTHVAGTIVGETYGVAKAAQAIDVKVFVGEESTSEIILDGFNWAVEDIVSQGRAGRAVINLSLGGPRSSIWDTVVDAAWDEEILVVAASGNFDVPASTMSPANVANALTVGAIDESWAEADYSNYGDAVDILAPGHDVVSAGHRSDSATFETFGTSMAAPHVAGVALYLIGLENITSASDLKDRILDLATTKGVTLKDSDTPARVLYNGVESE